MYNLTNNSTPTFGCGENYPAFNGYPPQKTENNGIDGRNQKYPA